MPRLGLGLTALGVVYGDIGTSPLYAMRECFWGPHAIDPSPDNVMGVLSLLLWSLILVVSLKYLVLILRADNGGEGGVLALMTLAGPNRLVVSRRRQVLLGLGVFGAALLYGDGMITPAISVLSASEGLTLLSPRFAAWTPLVALGVLLALFSVQRWGTARVGALFGPVMLLWFGALAFTGIHSVMQTPDVLLAISPGRAFRFLSHNGWLAFVVLGSVFLVVTGAESLYADMGHVGRKAIRGAWFALVLPALVCNYFGQGALLLRAPTAAHQPFFQLVPEAWLLPWVLLSGIATVIASQAVLTGAFSLTRQAVSLGLAPRFTIRHTSARERGQIYVPAVNWFLCGASLLLILAFGTSSRLAAAYGIAVTSTMVITTLLFLAVMRDLWHWPRVPAYALGGLFLTIDLAFLGANMLKIPEGGWFPIAIALLLGLGMTTWRRGRELLAERLRSASPPIESLPALLQDLAPQHVPGTALFCTSDPDHTPPALLANLKYNRVLHERVGILTVIMEPQPRVPEGQRVVIEPLAPGLFGVFIHYGYLETPDVPAALRHAGEAALGARPEDVLYFLGGETLRATGGPGMALWREQLFTWLARNAQRASRFFRLPAERIVELGTQVDL